MFGQKSASGKFRRPNSGKVGLPDTCPKALIFEAGEDVFLGKRFRYHFEEWRKLGFWAG